MPNWEEFDTWEPSQDYPSAPPARSSSLGKPPARRLPPPDVDGNSLAGRLVGSDSGRGGGERNPAEANAASFFEEFSAATEAADNTNAFPLIRPVPGESSGIAALLANAQNMLNSDGPASPDDLPEPPVPPTPEEDFTAELPEAMRPEITAPLAPGEPEHPEPPAPRTVGRQGRKATQRKPEPVRSEGWKSLVAGWDEVEAAEDKPAATAASPTPPPAEAADPFEALKTGSRRGSKQAGAHPDLNWEETQSVSPRTPEPAPLREDLSEPRWKSLTAQTPEGPTQLRMRRVGTGTPPSSEREGLSPLIVLAGAVVLSLVSVGVGVGVGMNVAPQPTVTVTATPSDYFEPDPNSPNSVGNSPTPDPGAVGAGGLNGLKVAIDPGHNGGNAAAWQQIGSNVPDGRGGQKPCNTTGTATNDGFAEHDFNWKVANALKSKLEAAGAVVLMTRDSDAGVGPCVDARGQFPQKVGADVMVSIHANGTTDTAVHGFFVMISDPPLKDAQKEPATKLANGLIKSLQDGGFVPQSTGAISGGLWKRSDIATLNFAEVPAVMVELGEMRNPADAALMKSDSGQDRYAQSLFDGLKSWAEAMRPPATSTPTASPSATSTGSASPDATGASPAGQANPTSTPSNQAQN